MISADVADVSFIPMLYRHTIVQSIIYHVKKNCIEIVVKSQNIVEQANSHPNNTSLTLSRGHIISIHQCKL